MCATALVGPRPKPVLVPPPEVPSPAVEENADEAEAPVDAREALAREAAMLPPARPPSNSILSNVLLFIAFLMLLVVGIYISNKDAPKTVQPVRRRTTDGIHATAVLE